MQAEQLPSNSYVNDANQAVNVPLSTPNTPRSFLSPFPLSALELELKLWWGAARGVHGYNSKTQATP